MLLAMSLQFNHLKDNSSTFIDPRADHWACQILVYHLKCYLLKITINYLGSYEKDNINSHTIHR